MLAKRTCPRKGRGGKGISRETGLSLTPMLGRKYAVNDWTFCYLFALPDLTLSRYYLLPICTTFRYILRTNCIQMATNGYVCTLYIR